MAIQADLAFQWIDPRLRYVDSRVTIIQGEDWGRDKSIKKLKSKNILQFNLRFNNLYTAHVSLDSSFYHWERKELEQDSHSQGERPGLFHSRGIGLLS